MDDVVKVLLVEDDDVDAENAKRELASWTRHVFQVEHVRTLTRMAQSWDGTYDVLVLDLNLPDSTGLDTLREALVRAHDRPIVVFSGADDQSDGMVALTRGAEDYVPKGSRGRIARSIAYAIERHRLTHAARAAAVLDELTGLPNRALFYDRLQSALRRANRHDHGVAVLYIDLDSFKPINDRYGHAIGDLVLEKVGSRLHRALRGADTVARLGGDEFGVVLEEVGSDVTALAVAHKLRTEIRRDISLRNLRDDTRFQLSIDSSIGVALYPNHAHDAASLVRCADLAMYEAKASSEERTAVYRPTSEIMTDRELAPAGAVSAEQTVPPLDTELPGDSNVH